MKWLAAFALLSSLEAVSLHAAAPQCVSCHKEQALHQPSTPMGRAMIAPAEKGVMGSSPRMEFHDGKYVTTIQRAPEGLIYSVTDGANQVTTPVAWAFGLGEAGQTYMLRMDGRYYESRVSYFQKLRGLDYTLGAKNSIPGNLREAMGRELSPKAAADCFGCHSTPGKAEAPPGLQCDTCHAGALLHATSFATGKPAPMTKLGAMSSEETNEFCGRCHRTWAYIAENGPRGPMNVRFQPYRLTNSKCYDAADRRIACVACHNPHQDLARNSAAYDDRCQSCHSPQHAGATLCKTGKNNCVSCHMPKVEMEGAHYQFTDHRIRIVRKGEPYPD